MHIGQSSSLCPQLSVNGFEMAYSELEKYLGELLSKDCQNNPNIIAKASKGLGLIAQIKVLISEISLGFHYFEVATLLRDSILINGMLTNIEVIYGLTEENLKVLENVDKIFIQYILSGHSKTKHEAYYLELGIIPIKFIVMSRRIMFLHYLLSRNANELLVKFFKAQVSKPGKNDWFNTVQKDLIDLDINLSFEEIGSFKKGKFKRMLKVKVKKAALSYLTVWSVA